MCSLHKASKGRVKPMVELDAVYSLKLKQKKKKGPGHFKLPTVEREKKKKTPMKIVFGSTMRPSSTNKRQAKSFHLL